MDREFHEPHWMQQHLTGHGFLQSNRRFENPSKRASRVSRDDLVRDIFLIP